MGGSDCCDPEITTVVESLRQDTLKGCCICLTGMCQEGEWLGCGVTSSQQTLGEHLWASTPWFSENHTFTHSFFLIFCEGDIINCVVMISKLVLVAVML